MEGRRDISIPGAGSMELISISFFLLRELKLIAEVHVLCAYKRFTQFG